MLKNQNTAPQNALHFKIKFTTNNLDDGSTFQEPFIVNGPTGSFNTPLNAVPHGGNKILIPLTSNTSEGANYLKIWLPQPSSDVLYVTFSKKANSMRDGYYDYITGIPSDYRADFRNWIADGRTPAMALGSLNKYVFFTAYGKNTNQSSETIQFRLDFTGMFTGSGPSAPTSAS